jgi:hypothetical protein
MFEKKFLELIQKLPQNKADKLKQLFYAKTTTNLKKIELIAIIEDYLENL